MGDDMTAISISVIVSCFNLHKYLDECVESVKNQTMQPSELIIVHDGCTGPCPTYGVSTDIVRKKNFGVARTRHEGVLLSQSEQLLFLDADDCLDEYFIEAMIKMKASSKSDIIYPNVFLWSNWSKDHPMRNGWHESAPEITKEKMMEYNQIVVSSLIPRVLYDKVGGFGKEPILEDYAFFLKCLESGATFSKSPQSVLRYRQRLEGRNRRNDELKNEWYYRIKEQHEKP
jgi:glycosyltransferase involved in cell wall biosynthesis